MKPLSKKRAKEIAAIKDEDLDYSDIPALDATWFRSAKLVYPQSKKPISLRIDPDMIEWYKRESNGSGYQSLMHAVLRTYMIGKQKEKR